MSNHEPDGPVWVKSSLSFANGNCVEVQDGKGEVRVRNSRDPGGGTLVFTPDEWQAFLGGVRTGEFDHFGGGAPVPAGTGAQAARYRKRPVEVGAVRWTGANASEVFGFTGREYFDVLDDQDRANGDDPEATATVFDKLHSTWILVYDGDWVIKGTAGELYPNRPAQFAETYEPAGDPQ